MKPPYCAINEVMMTLRATGQLAFSYDKNMELKLQSLASLEVWKQLFERNYIPQAAHSACF